MATELGLVDPVVLRLRAEGVWKPVAAAVNGLVGEGWLRARGVALAIPEEADEPTEERYSGDDRDRSSTR